MINWSLAAYVFCLIAGLGLAIASGFLGEILGHAFGGHDAALGHGFGGHDIGHDIGHGLHVDHGVHVSHEAAAGHGAAGGETSGATDVAAQLSPVSPPVISTFLTMFGLFGMVGEMGLKWPTAVAAPSAAVASLVLATLVFVVIAKFLAVSQGTSHTALRDLIGTDAEVITPIPANGVGEVAYVCQTGRASLPARSEGGTMIPKHSMVIITDVVGSTALVRETIDEQLRSMSQKPASEAGTV
jgi:hypothetical protein